MQTCMAQNEHTGHAQTDAQLKILKSHTQPALKTGKHSQQFKRNAQLTCNHSMRLPAAELPPKTDALGM